MNEKRTFPVRVEFRFHIECNIHAENYEQALERARKKYDGGAKVDLTKLNSQCIPIVSINDQLPAIGEKLYLMCLEETLLTHVEVWANSLEEAEEHIRKHMSDYDIIGNADSIGCNVYPDDWQITD